MEYDRIIITGASSGLGEVFARELAKTAAGEACEMILIARRQERLERLAQELQERHSGVRARAMGADLAEPAERERLLRELTALPARRSLLVNNAGLGDYGEFATSEASKNNRLMQVNMLAAVELTHGLLPQMLEAGGDIINTASLAADVALPDFALYAASKAFLAAYSEGLRLELRGRGVRTLAVCPGPVHTEFGSVAQRAGHDRGDMPLKQWFYTPAETVVRAALRALKAGRARCYPSMKIWLSASMLHTLPLWAHRLLLGTRPRRVKQLKTNA